MRILLSGLLFIIWGVAVYAATKWYTRHTKPEVEAKTRIYEIFDSLIAVGIWYIGVILLHKFAKTYIQFVFWDLILTVGIVALFTVVRKRTFKDIGISNQNLGRTVILSLMLIGIYSAANYCGILLKMHPYPIRIGTPSLKIALIILGMAIINPGVIEELLFRGFVLSKLERCMNWKIALVCSAIIFGLVHIQQGLFACLGALYLGLLLGYTFHYTKNLITTIFPHAIGLTLPLIIANIFHIL